MKGCLYIVGTPIGNLKDISFRAIEVLKEVDFIIVEDSRVSLKLLNFYSIKKPLISNHKFSDFKKTLQIIKKLQDGENAALISDAGMPLICDPGQGLIELCHEKEISLKIVPGPCALICALCLSGFNCSKFTFLGFLSKEKKEREKTLIFLKQIEHTVVLYESPHKLLKTLKDLLKHLKDREIVILKELTKFYEEYDSTTLEKSIEKFEKETQIKGEFVIVLKGLHKKKEKGSLKEAVELAKSLILKGEKKTTAAKKAATVKNQNKSVVYKEVLKYIENS